MDKKIGIAFYLRLSAADGDLGVNGKDESNSIENQRMLLYNYVNSRTDLDGEIFEYADDGFSGTNFNRPAFKKMIEDAKKGLIQIVLVKDLSRLGRDYITVGDYIEQIFPMLRVRFIAVNNKYDSNRFTGGTMGFDMAVSNLINAFYSRDLSKKLRASNKTKWKNGISTSGSAPFGYIVSKKEKGKWDIDSEAAKIVRIIFDKALEGMKTTEIAAYLNENKYPTPWMYNRIHQNWKLADFDTKMEERLWDCSKVSTILNRYDYTGSMIMGRTKVQCLGSGKSVRQPQSEWTIVEGVNEAIISHEEFEQARSVLRAHKKPAYHREREYALKGKLYCGNCNRRLTYGCNTYKEVCYCRSGRQIGEYSQCYKDDYDMKYIEDAVMKSLKDLIATLQALGEKTVILAKENMSKGIIRQENIKTELEKLTAEKIRLYERYAEQMITKELYIEKKKKLLENIKHLEESALKQAELYEEQKGLWEMATHMKALACEFKEEDKISSQIVEAFISKVKVYGKNQIEIEFLFEDEIKKLMDSTLDEVNGGDWVQIA